MVLDDNSLGTGVRGSRGRLDGSLNALRVASVPGAREDPSNACRVTLPSMLRLSVQLNSSSIETARNCGGLPHHSPSLPFHHAASTDGSPSAQLWSLARQHGPATTRPRACLLAQKREKGAQSRASTGDCAQRKLLLCRDALVLAHHGWGLPNLRPSWTKLRLDIGDS